MKARLLIPWRARNPHKEGQKFKCLFAGFGPVNTVAENFGEDLENAWWRWMQFKKQDTGVRSYGGNGHPVIPS